jgi:selenocysteine lyase/cysteine desulfurase
VRHPLSLVSSAQARGHRVLLDAAAYLPTQTLDLSACTADYVALSFYKLFGYPTGLGALVARRDALAVLRRPWFAGGTVRYASVHADLHRLHDGHTGFEDGTPDFLSIAALAAGFDLLERVGMQRLAAHVAQLTERFLRGMASLRHRNGVARAQVHGPQTMHARGGTVAFNMRDRLGRVIPYWDVESLAREAGIALRGGCFCNPGASEVALRLPATRSAECLSALGDAFEVQRFSRCIGSPVGALRASFGMFNTESDIDRALAFLDAL